MLEDLEGASGEEEEEEAEVVPEEVVDIATTEAVDTESSDEKEAITWIIKEDIYIYT